MVGYQKIIQLLDNDGVEIKQRASAFRHENFDYHIHDLVRVVEVYPEKMFGWV